MLTGRVFVRAASIGTRLILTVEYSDAHGATWWRDAALDDLPALGLGSLSVQGRTEAPTLILPARRDRA